MSKKSEEAIKELLKLAPEELFAELGRKAEEEGLFRDLSKETPENRRAIERRQQQIIDSIFGDPK
jgi:hypothetical protein